MEHRHGLRQVCRAESEARAARDGNLPRIVDGKVHGPSSHDSLLHIPANAQGPGSVIVETGISE